MPELPEVETVRADLEKALLGARVASVRVTHPRAVRRQSAAAFSAALEGRGLETFGRVGKYLVVGLDSTEALVVHLRMSGSLALCAGDEPVVRHTHVVLGLSGGDELRFVDPRTFGELFVSRPEPSGRPPELAALGPDPLTDGLDVRHLAAICANRRAALKTVLLNQHLVAGIGNIYGDEICFAAGIRPNRRAGRLRRAELERLAEAVRAVLDDAVALRGSTLSDARYRDLLGNAGSYQDHHRVYGRGGEPCPSCGTAIVRRLVGGRAAHWCTSCQH